MGKLFESRAAKAAVLASGTALSMCADILIAAVLTRTFLKAEYATYQQTFLAFNFVVPILALGIPTALFYFVPQRRLEARAVVFENLSILSLGASAFVVFLLCGGSRLLAWRFGNPELAETLLLLAPYAYFELYSRAVGPCLMAHDRAPQVAAYNVATRLLLLVLVVSAALAFDTPKAVVLAAVVSAGVRMALGLWLIWRATDGTHAVPTTMGALQQFRYGVPLGIAGIFGTMMLTLDKVVVASICDRADFAVYSVGAFEVPAIGAITGSITAVLLADLASMFHSGRRTEATQMWGRAAAKSSLILFPLMVVLFVYAESIIALLFSKDYTAAALPFRVYLLALPLRVVNYGSMIMSAGRSKLVLLQSATALALNVALSIAMTGIYGSIGAAISTVLILYCWTVPFNLLVIARIWDSPLHLLLPWAKLSSLFLLTWAGAPVLLLAGWANGEAHLLVMGVCTSIYLLFLITVYIRVGMIERASLLRVYDGVRRRLSGLG